MLVFLPNTRSLNPKKQTCSWRDPFVASAHSIRHWLRGKTRESLVVCPRVFWPGALEKTSVISYPINCETDTSGVFGTLSTACFHTTNRVDLRKGVTGMFPLGIEVGRALGNVPARQQASVFWTLVLSGSSAASAGSSAAST